MAINVTPLKFNENLITKIKYNIYNILIESLICETAVKI